MDPKDYERFIMTSSTLVYNDDLLRERLPAAFLQSRVSDLASDMKPFVESACAQHLRTVFRDCPEFRAQQLRTEIAILPAEELRTLLGFVGKLQAAVHSVRAGQVPQSVEAQL